LGKEGREFWFLFLIIALCLVGLIVLGLFILVSSRSARSARADTAYGRELIAVGDANFPPFTFMENGEPAGFDIDILSEIAKRKDLRLTIKLMDWSSAMTAVRTGSADILVGVSDLEERRAYLSFSERMISMKSQLFVRNDTYAYTKMEDLTGVPVGVEKGDVVAQYLAKTHPHIALREYQNQRAALEALAAHEIPVAILDYYSGLLSLQKLDMESRVKVIGDPILEAAYCLGTKKDNTALLVLLNDGIESLKYDGTMQRVLDRWIGVNVVQAWYWRYAIQGLAALGLSAAALLFWNFALRNAVRERTQELSESNEQFRLYMEYSPVYMFFKDEKLKPIMLSRNFGSLVGKPISDAMNTGTGEHYTPDLLRQIAEADQAVLETGQPIESVLEIAGRTFNTIRFPIPRKGKPTRLAGFYIDVTEEIRSKENLLKSLREKETLIRELYHRTKNTLQVVSSLIELQAAEYPDDAALQSLVKSAEDRIYAISLVHQLLYKSQDLSKVSIREYLDALSAGLYRSYEVDPSRIRLDLRVADQSMLLDLVIPIGLIINELMTNSFKHAFPDGRQGLIVIELFETEPNQSLLRYTDDGVGTGENFDFKKQNTLGLQLIFNIGENQLMGNVKMEGTGGMSCSVIFKNDLYTERV
jgi:two-component sensor histidine kinase/ABC-type amino acid transport substrate-binding protein